jgi:hypothetical protein
MLCNRASAAPMASSSLCFRHLASITLKAARVDHMCLEVRRKVVASPYVIFACAMGWLGLANSQESNRDIPSNAHYSAGAQGWACNHGFTQVAGLCMVDSDVLPSEGAFEVFDGQWRCRSGYHRAGRFCLPGLPPEHAAFVGGGDHWECDWGFQKIGSQCQEIKPPPHAYIEASGRDWVCFPGFGRESDRCVLIPNPAPAGEATTTPPEELTPRD